MRCRKMCFLSLIVFLCIQIFIVSNVRAGNSSVHFILDCSRSIEEVDASRNTLLIASEFANQVMGSLSEPIGVGLTLFLPEDNEACGRIDLTAPVGNDQREIIRKKLDDAKAAGTSPLTLGLQKTAELLSGNEDMLTIVLITDGRSVSDDLLKTARELRGEYDYRISYYVVGIDPDANRRQQMHLIAFAGGGLSLQIGDAKNVSNVAGTLAQKLNNPVTHTPRIVTDDDMVLIPEGNFLMGDASKRYSPHERPAHEVDLDAFFIDRYEVTQRQFREVMGKNPSLWIGSDLPVDSVSWNDARQFCEKVGKRLPTEAEWEKAAKGGTDDSLWAGTSSEVALGDYAWCDDTGAGEGSAPVGLKKPNGYGIYDMSGNLQEWVSDWYDPKYYSSSPEKNPRGPEHGALRVLRGGYWDDHILGIRTTARAADIPDIKYGSNGFRCVRSAEE